MLTFLVANQTVLFVKISENNVISNPFSNSHSVKLFASLVLNCFGTLEKQSIDMLSSPNSYCLISKVRRNWKARAACIYLAPMVEV